MKLIKYTFAIILLLLSIGEIMPIYLIISGLLTGQSDGNTAYWIGKLFMHIVIALVMFYLGLKLIKNVQDTNAASVKNT
jgi:hypothetical protein